MEEQTINVDGHQVRITNWSKVLWPTVNLTKGDLIRYYSEAALYLLPHLQNRPLTVTRFPSGVDGEWFYQKNCPASAPDFVETILVAGEPDKPEKTINYILVQNRATLVWLANQAAIELHPWLSLYTRPQYPDWLVFDLDPGEKSTFDDTREIAFLVKKALTELGLRSYPKLSGATGIHVYVPILPKYTYATTSKFVGDIGKIIGSVYPEKVTTERLVKNRGGRVYIDHLQNLLGKTLAAPYSPRPLPNAPISTPVSWQELEHIYPHDFHLGNILSRLKHHKADPFAPDFAEVQSLDLALRDLGTPVI